MLQLYDCKLHSAHRIATMSHMYHVNDIAAIQFISLGLIQDFALSPNMPDSEWENRRDDLEQ